MLPRFILGCCLASCLTIDAARAVEVRLTPGGPINSLAAARDAIRQAREAGDPSAARVIVEDGVYPFDAAVAFEARDSNATYEAAPGAKPLFTGARKIEGWTAGPSGVWTTKVDPKWRFEALWINGERAVRARTPNAGFTQAMGQPLQVLQPSEPKADPAKVMLQVEPEVASQLSGLSPEELKEVNVRVHFSWDMQRHRVLAVRPEDGTVQFTGALNRAFFSLEQFHNLVVENYLRALDAPGEWFLALDGTLSYVPRPGETLDKVVAEAPVAPQWLTLKGAVESGETIHDITFRGLSFSGQAWTLPPGGAGFGQAEVALGAAIEVDGAKNLLFENCEFAHTMTNVAWFRKATSQVVVRHCYLHDLGAGGVKIGETGVPKKPEEITSHVTVENSIIHGGGRYFPGAHAIWIGQNPDNTVRHCDLADFYYTPISIGWVWGYHPTPCARNTVEDTHIHHFGWGVLSDMAAVYTLGPQPGTVIRRCHVHDVSCSSYGGWGLYNDEGSTGILWEDNLVYRTQSGGYHQHYGRGNMVRNNIFGFSHEFQVRWSKPEEFLGFAFENNIVVFDEGRLLGHVDKNWYTGRVWLNRNVYWQKGGAPFDLAGKTWREWQDFGNDPESVLADPGFVAPEKGDWTLRPDSPALKLGFKPFNWRTAGVEGDDAWKKLAAVEYPDVTYIEKPKPRPLTLNEDFEATPIGAHPAHGARVNKQAGDILRISEGGVPPGKRGLLLTDGPNVTPPYDPHFYYTPHHESGLTKVAFDVRLEPGYELNHEWRDDAQPYQTGPRLLFQKGEVQANNRKLMALPEKGWMHVEVEAALGDKSTATWRCTITVEGQAPQVFSDLKFEKPAMKKLDWVGWSSNGKVEAKAWLDNIAIENKP